MISNKKDIYILRHGETDWNKLHLRQGMRNDIEMNEIGKEQSKYTGKYLNDYRQKDSKFDLIISSSLIRAKQTAEIVCNEIGYDKNDILYFDELKEIDYGLISFGKTDDEMRQDKLYDMFYKKMDELNNIEDPIESLLQQEIFFGTQLQNEYNYETRDNLIKRCNVVIEFIKNINKNKILVISHSGTIIYGLIPAMFKVHNLEGSYKYGANCHITYIQYNNNNFNMIMPPSTLHFNVYKKNYSNKKNKTK